MKTARQKFSADLWEQTGHSILGDRHDHKDRRLAFHPAKHHNNIVFHHTVLHLLQHAMF